MFATDHTRRVSRQVLAALADDPPGAAVALLVDGELWTSGIGYRHLARTEPLPADACFPIYSVTKTMTAVVTLDLVAKGRLDLDQPVVTILPETPIAAGITVRQLLNHTAGFADYGAMETYNADLRRDPGRPWSEQEFVDRVVAHGPLFAPGEGWAYANIGYVFLRQIVERMTGLPWAEVLATRIFGLLGMRQATVPATLADMDGLTPGYSGVFTGGELRDVAPVYHPGWVSHGVVAATAAEVATFIDALAAGRLLPAHLVDEMLAGVEVPGTHPRFTRATYGLGVMVDPASRFGRVAGHGGGGPGYSAGAFHFPDVHGRRMTSVALVNSDQGVSGLDLAFLQVEAMAGGDDSGRDDA